MFRWHFATHFISAVLRLCGPLPAFGPESTNRTFDDVLLYKIHTCVYNVPYSVQFIRTHTNTIVCRLVKKLTVRMQQHRTRSCGWHSVPRLGFIIRRQASSRRTHCMRCAGGSLANVFAQRKLRECTTANDHIRRLVRKHTHRHLDVSSETSSPMTCVRFGWSDGLLVNNNDTCVDDNGE